MASHGQSNDGFLRHEHVRNLLAGQWVDMFDGHGHQLIGIRGRPGVSAVTLGGERLGLDLMEMQPGSSFPIHAHVGDHIMYILSGCGVARVGGIDHQLGPGDSIYIPAEHPHNFICPEKSTEPLVFLAVGHPHRRLSAHDRMRKVLEG